MAIPIIALTLSLLLSTIAARPDHGTVFLEKQDASAVMSRHRRANLGDEEKAMPASLERECVEEVCNYEEAREIFQDAYRTDIFWSVYIDGDQCLGNPCKNGALCSDSVGGYDCVCKSGFSGVHCETDQTVCKVEDGKGCSQFCKPGYQSYECSCATGWKLQEEKDKPKETCIPEARFPCGKVFSMDLGFWTGRTIHNVQSGYEGMSCSSRQCPWQALLHSEESAGFCGGVILKESLVLTTVQCVSKYSRFQVVVAKGDDKEQVLYVSDVIRHPLYVEGRPENDLALVVLRNRIVFSNDALAACLPEQDFAESVLMSGKQDAVITGWKEPSEGSAGVLGARYANYLVYDTLAECRARHSNLVTNKMFCTEPRAKADCALGPGSVAVTLYRGAFFLTGVLSRAPGLDCKQGYVFHKVSRFLPWLQPLMAEGGGRG